MRIPTSVFAVGRYGAALAVVAGSVLLVSAEKKTEFTARDAAYYADSNTVSFVRPGLVLKIKTASVAADGTITVTYNITDPKGLPLDIDGIMTPGSVSVSYLAAYIPQGQTEFWSYATRAQTSPITKVTEFQAGTDSGGVRTKIADGEYKYTFKTKAVAKGGGAWDNAATHRVAVYGSRNLTEFDLGSFYDDDFVTWIPAGGQLTNNRDIIRTETCNKCHGSNGTISLAAHGGSRRSMEVCDVCHTSQTIDPDTGNSMAMDVLIHKIHMGADLPSVRAGTPYQVIGRNQSVADYSSVVFPAFPYDPRNCQSCHDQSAGASQATTYLTRPTRQACGSCHDNVNFATGANHVNLPQVSDNQCANCHTPQGDLDFDASITGAHVIPQQSGEVPGLVLDITGVDNAGAGKAPLVRFTVKTKAGTPVTMAQLTGGSNRLTFVMAGPASDYGYTSFGSDVTTPGYVSETANTKSQCDSAGACTYQFTHAVPAGATGTFAIGIEARRSATLLAGTQQQMTTNYGGTNDVFYFSVDGSTVQPRRQVVSIAKCNACHVTLSLHGANRNDNIEHCVLCHNPSNTDAAQRPNAVNPADKAAPAEGINMAWMVHRIHMGEQLQEQGAGYTVVGFGGSHNDFSEVRYPAFSKSGSPGYVQACDMCHVNGSENVLPTGRNQVVNPNAKLTPSGAVTSACTSCHNGNAAFGHAVNNTDAKFGESCDVCHAGNADFNAIKVHAAK